MTRSLMTQSPIPTTESTKFWRAATLGDVELLRATYITHSFAPHSHEGYAIGVIEQGAETFAYRGEVHVAGAGQVVLINPGEIHTGQALSQAGWSYRMLYPAAELVCQAVAQLTGRSGDYPFFTHAVVTDSLLAQQLGRFHRQLEQGLSPLESECGWLTLLTGLIQRHADDRQRLSATHPATDRGSLQAALHYLADHYAANVSLAELAAHVHLSPYHLLRTFKSAFGLPPHAYLNQLRVQRAKTLLRAGVAVAEVALMVGFNDQSHLTRHFKRMVGVPPGSYRQQL